MVCSRWDPQSACKSSLRRWLCVFSSSKSPKIVVGIPKAHVNHHSDAGYVCLVGPSHEKRFSRRFAVFGIPKAHVNHHSDAGYVCLVVPSHVKWYSSGFAGVGRPKPHVNADSNLISACKSSLRRWLCVFSSSKSRKMVFQVICSHLQAQSACKSCLQPN